MTEFPDLAPWAERRRLQVIEAARAHVATDCPWRDAGAAAQWVGEAKAHIDMLIEELEGTDQ